MVNNSNEDLIMNAKLILIPIFLIGLCMVQSDEEFPNRIDTGSGNYNKPNPKYPGSTVTTKPETLPRPRNINLEYGDIRYNYKASTCGYRNKNGVLSNIKNVSNNEAEFGEFPWMVRIIKKGKVVNSFKCGGSLIAPRVVLTGAHCVKSLQALNYLVRAGEWESNSDDEPFPHQERQVVEIIMHENFDDGDFLENNIALLFLETEFDAAPHIKTVCLPPANTNFDMSRCIASGWGRDKFGSKIHRKIMKKINLRVVPKGKCQNALRKTRLGEYFELHSSFICAGGEIGKDTCKGDGGSPLVCPMANNPDRYYQVGIVSWGIGCGDKNVPGIYASVPHLRSWIDKQLADKDIDTKFFTP
ncbi:phenoloxidase-activating factor 2-like isoform X1 [Episyrphus balteatus]|uniref:phenoloxidase-activating factor 2-like isoform X1 n=2 Tax=Episyrphus balteatus TaxID=286459 RepID=UPI002485BA14|nr:phenoloxidase-activating factor 2-like isoform X1 [Episyrphus balteatus]